MSRATASQPGPGARGSAPARPVGRLGRPRHGTVVAFDPSRGVGVVEVDEGSRWPFHCVELSDGSRAVPIGARVVFVLGPAHAGLLEARQLVRP